MNIITKLIYNNIFLLLIKKAFININKLKCLYHSTSNIKRFLKRVTFIKHIIYKRIILILSINMTDFY